MIVGTPARSSAADLMYSRTRGCAISDINAAVIRPSGIAKMSVTSVTQKVAIRGGITPKRNWFGSVVLSVIALP